LFKELYDALTKVSINLFLNFDMKIEFIINFRFHYKAFWALYLPHSVSFRLTDIWRSYWAQRLMWLLNSTLSFHGPNAYQLRNSHSYLEDYKQETNMYTKTQELIQFLYEWKCKYKSFYSCLLDMSEKMALNNFWSLEEVNSIKYWLFDLRSIGYIEPNITNFEYETSHLKIDEFLSLYNNKNGKNAFDLRYSPYFETFIDMNSYYGHGKEIMKLAEKHQTIHYFKDYCGSNFNLTYSLTNFKKFPEQHDIILLITFNHEPILENILFLNELHQSFFKKIVFCGKNIRSIVKSNENNLKKFDSFSLIDFDTHQGYLHYHCMSKVIDMNYKSIHGILLMSDDVLLKHWNLNVSAFNSIWYPTKFPLNCSHDLDDSSIYWMKTDFGMKALKKTAEFIEATTSNMSTKTDENIKHVLKEFLELSKNGKNLNKICYDASDIFYIPRRLFHKFNVLSRVFSSNNVFLELAVPTILNGLDGLNHKDGILQGWYNWGKRIQFDKEYNSLVHFTHHFKLSEYNSPEKRSLVCKYLIQDKFNYL